MKNSLLPGTFIAAFIADPAKNTPIAKKVVNSPAGYKVISLQNKDTTNKKMTLQGKILKNQVRD
jgi:hypothetical protein